MKFKQMLNENNIERIDFYWKDKFESKKDDKLVLNIEVFSSNQDCKKYDWILNVLKRSLRYEYDDLMQFWKIGMKSKDNMIIIYSNKMRTIL